MITVRLAFCGRPPSVWLSHCYYLSVTVETNVKITLNATEHFVTLKIEGRVADVFVAEFQRVWQKLVPSIGQRKFSIDLRGVTFMDSAGRQQLAQIYAQTGAEFVAITPMTKYFVEEAMQAQETDSLRETTGGYDERSLRIGIE
jgi:anti-anti-sigma factor